MSKPSCPICDSPSVIPDPRPGGAGRNFCQGCGHCSAVRDFHQPKAAFDPSKLKRGRRWTEVYEEQYQGRPAPAAPAPQKPRKRVDRQRDVVHNGHQEDFWWMKD